MYSASDIDNMPQRVRANFINSLSGFKSANLIGTVDLQGIDNLAMVSSVFHIGAHPPLLGMIMRPHTVARDTLQNIKDNGEYTINHVSCDFIAAAHQTSANYSPITNEFDETGLTSYKTSNLKAPYVTEANIALGLQVQDIQLLAINNTELVIGQVVEVLMRDDYTLDDGYVDIEKAQGVAVSGLDSYHVTTRKGRFSYAKAGQSLSMLPPEPRR